MYGEASSLDPTAYLPQRDRSKVLLVLMAEQKHQNESNMDVPEARITAPKTVSDKIGEIKTVTDFLSLMVNVMNNSAAYVDFDAMKINSSPRLLRDLSMNFILMINGNFTTWMDNGQDRRRILPPLDLVPVLRQLLCEHLCVLY